MRDLPTTWGIPGTQTIPVRESAVVVSRLEAAGAIILGKTNLAMQLADWQSSNPVYGTTNNPWDVNRTPGGSSGGSAAALAAGFVSLELGSDLNGSLRIPAHCCGVYGHRPTFAVVPTRGFSPPGVPVLSANAGRGICSRGSDGAKRRRPAGSRSTCWRDRMWLKAVGYRLQLARAAP